MSRKRKYVFATSWNCSNKLTGRKVTVLYLEVMMQLFCRKMRWEKMSMDYFNLLSSLMIDSGAGGETSPRTETSHCTPCRWLWPVSPPLQTHKQSVSKTERAQHLKPPHLSSAKTARSSLKSSIIGNILPDGQSDGGNNAWYVCVLQARTHWSAGSFSCLNYV